MAASPKAIIMDIEGTVAPISFVTEVLFPYVSKNLPAYLDKTWETVDTKADVTALLAQSEADVAASVDGVVAISPAVAAAASDVAAPAEAVAALKAAVLANVAWQMSLNRKMGALKGLQGHVWRDAFVSGEVKGQIYGDVYDAMRRWRAAGVKLYIYSSGSVEAQKLVFGHSVHGDMTPLLDGYFDTAVGHKRERGAYDAILAAIDCAPAEALFLTDIYEESVAADAAGMGTILLIRDGNAPLPEGNEFPTATTFDSIC